MKMTTGGYDGLEFEEADLDWFSAVSLDRSPLHLNASYARTTPYGQPVVFGVLTALACLGRLSSRPGAVLRRITIDFRKPVFARVRYRVESESEANAETAAVRLFDGSQLMLKATCTFAPGAEAPPADFGPALGISEARTWELAEITPARQMSGHYAPDGEHLAALALRFGLRHKGIGAAEIAALVASSYLVGMELPGRNALLSRLDLHFAASSAAATPGPLGFDLKVARVDSRFGLITMSLLLTAGAAIAKGELQAFFRSEVAPLDRARIDGVLPPSNRLRGKTALVVGASRGLGAAIALGLANRGATVLAAFHKSQTVAERLVSVMRGAPGSLQPVVLDAGDPISCGELRRALAAGPRGIDFLVCNASPPLHTLPLEPATSERINAFVATAVAQVSTPLAHFLELLADRQGVGVVVSSGALKAPRPAWPHYLAAKAAIEALAAVASVRVPFLIVRPPALLTDMTNTPLGRANATAPENIAAALVRRLEGDRPTGLEWLLEFANQ